ncbi:agamous-like MADS-box protein AGL14 [Tripterygium wilfordii]|uniref:Agamous-like MADS-box protein AGL14 n=1 Tax=Tripterygium wilfordii TaxID=458696 RepID=A0A7J7DAI1_TRIWF|nr:agamous-like MADS-box protein AGL14 [Tripterygium wilfordii]
MELMSNEQSRMRTYQKRKKGLMKMTYEFSTLCGVEVCVIIHEDRSAGVETWPKNPNEVKGIIDKHRSVESQDLRGKNPKTYLIFSLLKLDPSYLRKRENSST